MEKVVEPPLALDVGPPALDLATLPIEDSKKVEEEENLFPLGFVYFDGIRHAPDSYRPKEFKISLGFPLRKDLIIIRKLPMSHPAYDSGKGIGVFARIAIQKGTKIGEYGGNLLSEKKYNQSSNLKERDVFSMGFGSALIIDAYKCGNETRFFNDFHGIGKQNTKFYDVTTRDGMKHKVFETIRDVTEGEELLCTYGPRYCKNFGIEWYEVDANGDRIVIPGQKKI